MATIRETKRRIKTSKNISQVTRAMEMVSAVKMRKAQEAALNGRSYSDTLTQMVYTLATQIKGQEDSIFLKQKGEVKKVLLIIMAPKKGLCGPLIGNLQRAVARFVLSNQEFPTAEFSFATLGKKSLDVVKVYNKQVLADFEIFERGIDISAIDPLSSFALQEFIKGNFDSVFIAFTEFVSTMTQQPIIKQFLPIPKIEDNATEKKLEPVPLFEPSIKAVLDSLMDRYTLATLYQYYLESIASEHSARMVAMKNAHDSADDIVSDLTLYYNKMRQNGITTELADSVSSRLGQEQ